MQPTQGWLWDLFGGRSRDIPRFCQSVQVDRTDHRDPERHGVDLFAKQLKRTITMRILLVGPAPGFKPSMSLWWSNPQAGFMFYSFGQRLLQGFIRNGHLVISFNDRDYRKAMFSSKTLGAQVANARLLHIARELQPDLLCLYHCDLITVETVLNIKSTTPDCRIATIYYDTIFTERGVQRLRQFQSAADFAFVTTGGKTLAKFADQCPVAFIPNPIDLSIDNVTAFGRQDHTADVFYASGWAEGERWRLIEELCRKKPELRYALYGRGGPRLMGWRYYEAMAQAKIGLNLSFASHDLFSSDRMAQYLGSGLLLATPRSSGYDHYFSDDEMLFLPMPTSLPTRSHGQSPTISAGGQWRKNGRGRASAIMSEQAVTKFIADMTVQRRMPSGWQFSDDIFGAPAVKALDKE